MNRWFLVGLCSIASLGCGGDGEPPRESSPPGPDDAPGAEAPLVETTILGMILEMHDSSPTRGGELRKPVFTATTEEATLGAGNTYTAKGIKARAEREGDSPVTFEAPWGSIDLDNNVAELRGDMERDVELRVGGIVMNLKDVTWDSKSGTARSDRELSFRDGSAVLTADGMELNTKDKTYALRNPSGRISLTQQGDPM